MGLFSFIRDVGATLLGASPAQAATAEALRKEVEKHGLKADDLNIAVEGDTVKVSGKTASSEIAEKIVLALGNTVGVSKVDSTILASDGVAESRMYTVKSGDTLSKISKDMYGDATKYNAIFEANRPMLTHPDKIYPGQVLRIPAP